MKTASKQDADCIYLVIFCSNYQFDRHRSANHCTGDNTTAIATIIGVHTSCYYVNILSEDQF